MKKTKQNVKSSGIRTSSVMISYQNSDISNEFRNISLHLSVQNVKIT